MQHQSVCVHRYNSNLISVKRATFVAFFISVVATHRVAYIGIDGLQKIKIMLA